VLGGVCLTGLRVRDVAELPDIRGVAGREDRRAVAARLASSARGSLSSSSILVGVGFVVLVVEDAAVPVMGLEGFGSSSMSSNIAVSSSSVGTGFFCAMVRDWVCELIRRGEKCKVDLLLEPNVFCTENGFCRYNMVKVRYGTLCKETWRFTKLTSLAANGEQQLKPRNVFGMLPRPFFVIYIYIHILPVSFSSLLSICRGLVFGVRITISEVIDKRIF